MFTAKIENDIYNNNNININMKNVPWIIKYRPSKLDNIIQQTTTIKLLKQMVKTQNIPNLLFHGPTGTGKTSTIYAFAIELFGTGYNDRILELNASDERGINIVRTKITNFSKSIISAGDKNYPNPPIKIIILDEADCMTIEAQSALRKLMETVQSTRFCFICNYKNQIIDPIQSRCSSFRFVLINQQIMFDKLKKIAKIENMTIADEALEIITKISEGDIRKGIMTLQNIHHIDNNITPELVKITTGYIEANDIEKYFTNSKSMKEITDKINSIVNMGYSINYICDAIKTMVVNSDKTDIEISNVFEFLANIDAKLCKGADEYIQLLSLSVCLKQNGF